MAPSSQELEPPANPGRFNILIQFTILDQKLMAYDEALHAAFPFSSDREQARQRLGFFFRIQGVGGVKRHRGGIVGLSLKLVGWLTLVAAPVLILLQALLTFLPYHNSQAVWIIRSLIVVDAVLVIVCWNAVGGSVPSEDKKSWFLRLSSRVFNALVLSLLVGFAVLIATHPGETFTEKLPFNTFLTRVRNVLFVGAVDEVTGRPRSYFSNRIVVTDQVLTTDQQGKITPVKSLRGRDLREAIFTRTDFRNVDFTGAMLNGAVFTDAKLQGANFGCGDTGASKEIASWLEEVRQLPWPDDGCTWAQNVKFNSANLERSRFFFSHLEGSNFSQANLSWAELNFVRLNGASLQEATLVGITLRKSRATGSSFSFADLRGSSLFETDFTGASFDEANLSGAFLNRANFDGALLFRAKLQGSVLDDVSFRGAFLARAQLWRAHWNPKLPPTVEFTNLSEVEERAVPWEGEFDSRQRNLQSWQKAILKSATDSEKEEAMTLLSGLDSKRSFRSRISLRGFATKEQPQFDVGRQLTFLADFLCSEDADFPIANRIVGGVTLVLKEKLISDDQFKMFASKVLEATNRKQCPGLPDEVGGEVLSMLRQPSAIGYYDLLRKPIPGYFDDETRD